MKIPGESDASRSFDRPPLQLGAVTATGSYQNGKPVHVALKGDSIVEGVETSASFRLFFDRFLWPKTVLRQSVCLLPKDQPVAKIGDCGGPGQPFTAPEYNPVQREVIYRLPAGARLKPGTQYRLTVFAVPTPADSGFFAFDGAPLATTYTFDFTTKDGATAQDEEPPSPEKYCKMVKCVKACATAADMAACEAGCSCLDPTCGDHDGDLVKGPYVFDSCAFSPCHAESANDPKHPLPPMGLDLSIKARIGATAISAPAHATQQGEAATIPDVSGDRWGRAMPIIDPSNPGNSFLVYKLIINARNFDDALFAGTTFNDELLRLRKGAIAGLPMPAVNFYDPTAPGGRLAKDGPTSQARLQLIDDWIAHGAVLTCK